MKKIFTSLLVCFLTVFMTVTSACAFDVNEIEKAYNKVIEYYKTHNELDLNGIIAVEALGLEAEDGDFKLPDFDLEVLKKSGGGTLGKNIVALSLIGKDPTQFEGTNLIDLLKQSINDDGSIQYSYGMSNDVWVLFALETVGDYETAELVADYLSNNINSDGGFWDYGYDENWNMTNEHKSSLDTTGWVIEALTVLNKDKYNNSIQKALDYLKNNQAGDATFAGEFGANTDTQACVLEGLFVYDIDMVMKSKSFDKNGISPIEYLLSFQTASGGFGYDDHSVDNAIATQDAGRCLGTYMNGSFVLDAQKEFEENKTSKDDTNENETTKEPVDEENPKVDVEKEEPNKENQSDKKEVQDDEKVKVEKEETVNKTTQSTQKEKVSTQNTKVVETDDNNNIIELMALTIIFAGIFVSIKKKNEKAC